MQRTNEKLNLWQKLAYGVGGIYSGGASIIVNFYYLIFLTDVVQIRPGLAGLIILISKLYDALTDPLEGVISDRTRTKLGRRKPYILAAIPLVALSFLALFYPYGTTNESWRFAFVLLANLFYSTITSIVGLNYTALNSELSLDYNERTSLSSTSMLFNSISSVICAIIPGAVVQGFDDIRTGYIVMGLSFGLFFALPFILVVVITHERPEFLKPPTPFDWRDSFLTPLKIRTFTIALMMFLLPVAAFDVVSSIMGYFLTHYLGRGDELGATIGLMILAQILSLPLFAYLSRRFDKKWGYILGAFTFVLVMLFAWFISPQQPPYLFYLLAFFIGFTSGGVVMMISAILSDIPDVDELVSGERREGVYAAIRTFMRKLASALALFIVGQALEFSGYVPPVKSLVDRVTVLTDQAQPDSFLIVLRLIFAFVPLLFFAVAGLMAWRYPLTAHLHRQLFDYLTDSRAGKVSLVSAQALKRVLVGK